jgi:hypothetical protein
MHTPRHLCYILALNDALPHFFLGRSELDHLTAKFDGHGHDSQHPTRSIMEAFHLLSRGANFDKQRFKSDVKLLSVCFYLHQPVCLCSKIAGIFA